MSEACAHFSYCRLMLVEEGQLTIMLSEKSTVWLDEKSCFSPFRPHDAAQSDVRATPQQTLLVGTI